MALRPQVADVLLALLDHADADALLVLMEPENVLALLRHDGWSDDAVRAALKTEKKLPGELLLGLFQRGRTTDELLDVLGPAAVAKVEAERARKPEPAAPGAPSGAKPAKGAADLAAPTSPFAAGRSRAQSAGLVVVLAAAIAPAMLAVFDLRIALAMLSFGIGRTLALIALAGGLGGVLASGSSVRWWIGALAGGAASAGGCAAVLGYALWNAGMGRTSLLRLEIAVVCMIGMLPGAALAAVLRRAVGQRA